MNIFTRIFLVALRLAIGWHFFFEGLEKVQSDAWTSEAYLREAQGPLADPFRELAGDRVVEQLTLLPTPDPGNPEMATDVKRFPPALARDWDAYFERFKNHYKLETEPAEPNQLARAEKALQQAKSTTANWLATADMPFRIESPLAPGAAADGEGKVADRIRTYQAKLEEVRQLEKRDRREFGAEVNTLIASRKAEANQIRGELVAGLRQQTDNMKAALRSVLTPEQQKALSPEEIKQPPITSWQAFLGRIQSRLGEWRHFGSMTQLERTDLLVRWGVYAVGLCLLAGLLTRTACVVGAFLLIMFFVAMPPLPGLPLPARAEGSYVYINKNIIEALALLVLATTRSGRWLGLDGLLQFLNPLNYRRQAEPPPPAPPRPPLAKPVAAS